jgi:hypothetical protein
MKDRETACWIVGGALAAFALLIGGVGHYRVKEATIWAEARVQVAQVKTGGWVGVAREIGEGIASLTD